MKLVTAVIKPHRLDEVKEALSAINITGLTVSEAQGYGRQGGHTETYRGTEYQISFTPKSRLDVVVDDPMLETTIRTIVEAARTGRIGDGKIWVTEVGQIIRIRTGEEGTTAI